MTIDLRGRSYLSELDFTAPEIHRLLDLAAGLKAARRAGTEQPRLTGKHIALIFEKTSTRTRCAFEVAAADQGARTTYLGPGDTHIGHNGFPAGSTGPKAEAAARFVEHTGGLAAIGALDAAHEIVHGRSGTLIRPDLTVG